MTEPQAPGPGPEHASRAGSGRAHVQIVVIDDHEMVATALVMGLETQGVSACHVPPVGERGILGELDRFVPTLVLLDLDLGRDPQGNPIDGVDLVRPLHGRGWRVLILSGSVDPARVGSALHAGAVAWVSKNAPFPTLLTAVRDAAAGRPVMPAEGRRRLIDVHLRKTAEQRELAEKLGRLTPREREVLAELALGKRAQAVADQFVVSVATVRTQIRAVLTKLEVNSQLEAAALYRRAHDD